jgi:hypothetical protein
MTAVYYSVEYRGDSSPFSDKDEVVEVYLLNGLVVHRGEIVPSSEAKGGSTKLTLRWATRNPRKQARQRVEVQYMVFCEEVEGVKLLANPHGKGWVVEYH